MKIFAKLQIQIDRELGYKICSICETQKDLDSFWFSKKLNRYIAYCNECRLSKRKSPPRKPVIEGDLERGNKTCTYCKETKQLKHFSFSSTRNIYSAICKECKNECRDSPSRAESPGFIKDNVIGLKICSSCKLNKTLDNFQAVDTKRGKYYYAACTSCKRKREKRISQTEKFKNRRQRYYKNRRITNIHFKIKHSLSGRVRAALKSQGILKSLSTMEVTGCSLEFLKLHLESQFEPWMNWQNHGIGEGKWVIDHFHPCELFDLENINEQKICFNYTNLRPLEWSKNGEKLDRLQDGRLARNLNEEERIEYLKSKGILI